MKKFYQILRRRRNEQRETLILEVRGAPIFVRKALQTLLEHVASDLSSGRMIEIYSAFGPRSRTGSLYVGVEGLGAWGWEVYRSELQGLTVTCRSEGERE